MKGFVLFHLLLYHPRKGRTKREDGGAAQPGSGPTAQGQEALWLLCISSVMVVKGLNAHQNCAPWGKVNWVSVSSQS